MCCPKLRAFLASALLVAGLGLGMAMRQREAPALALATATEQWLGTLNEAQTALAVLDFGSEARVGWHFIPKDDRKGVALKDMTEPQRAAALRLLRAALSEAGYAKASQVMLLESALRILEGPGSEQRRDPEKYYFTVFGAPRGTDRWGLSIEGHHLSLNFVLQGDHVLDSTPQFFGANPATVRDAIEGVVPKGLRVLGREEDLGFGVWNALDEESRKKALVSTEPPKEVAAAGAAQPELSKVKAGLSFEEMPAEAQRILKELVQVMAEAMPAEVAAARWEAIDRAGWNQISFSWAGATQPGAGYAYRVEGLTFQIEVNNTQPDAAGNPANHIHAVWRDATGDFDLPIR
jgi:hypothetical protein